MSISLHSNRLSRIPRQWFLWLPLLLVFPSFFFGGAAHQSSRSLEEFWNLGHFAYFALFGYLLDHYWDSVRRSNPFRVIAGLSSVMAVGLSIEVIQLITGGRSFSLLDLSRDLSGGAVILLLRIGPTVSRRWAFLSGALAIAVVIVNCIPLTGFLVDEGRAYRNFPLLAGFESSLELTRWGGDAEIALDTSRVSEGNSSARIDLTTRQYSGVSLRHFPGDWRGWNTLAFEVYNPGSRIELHYRVHDDLHQGDMQSYANRFNGTVLLNPGWNEILIPLAEIMHGPVGREMDLSRIRGFGIFVMQQNERRVLFLDDVRLHTP